LTETCPCTFGVGIADVAEIDSLNILRATHLAMARALAALSVPVNYSGGWALLEYCRGQYHREGLP
jgi:ribonuclease HII